MSKWQRAYVAAAVLALAGSILFGCQLGQEHIYTGFRNVHFGMTADAALTALGLEPAMQTKQQLAFHGLTDELGRVQDVFGPDRPYDLTLDLRSALTESSVHRVALAYAYKMAEADAALADFEATVVKLRPALALQRYVLSDDSTGGHMIWWQGRHAVSVQLAVDDAGSRLVVAMSRD